MEGREANVEKLLNSDSTSDAKKVKEMIKRTQKQLICENRLGYQKKSTGRPVSMDAIDEKFVLECIETKATAHGRCHNAVVRNHQRLNQLTTN